MSGGLSNLAKQQSNGMTSVKQQSGGLSAPMRPRFPDFLSTNNSSSYPKLIQLWVSKLVVSN